MKPDGSRAYVANQGSNNVSVINLATNTVIATVPVGTLPRKIALTPDGTHLVLNQSNNVSVIDLATNTVTATVPVGPNYTGIGVTTDGTQVYSLKQWRFDLAHQHRHEHRRWVDRVCRPTGSDRNNKRQTERTISASGHASGPADRHVHERNYREHPYRCLPQRSDKQAGSPASPFYR